MNPQVDPRLSKYNEPKSIYYHCTSLKKLLDDDDREIFKPLEMSLRKKNLLKIPFGRCYVCQSTEHWANECDRKNLNLCYACGSEEHFVSSCPTTRQQPEPMEVGTRDDEATESRKRKFSFEESSEEPPAKKRKITCFICKSDEHKPLQCPLPTPPPPVFENFEVRSKKKLSKQKKDSK